MAEPLAPVLVPVQKRIITWDPATGQPVLTSEPVLTKTHLQSLYFVVAAQPYIVEDPLDPDFAKYDGMTIAEVMVRKQVENAAKHGTLVEIETVMDRLIGKSMARSEGLVVHKTYEDRMREIRDARMRARAIPTIAEPAATPFGDLA